jgi:hypothetical protein
MVRHVNHFERSDYNGDSSMLLIARATLTASAYLGSHLSVFNDVWCTSPSVLSHEIGHNLRLRHAHEQGIAYGDITGLMGTSFL